MYTVHKFYRLSQCFETVVVHKHVLAFQSIEKANDACYWTCCYEQTNGDKIEILYMSIVYRLLVLEYKLISGFLNGVIFASPETQKL